MAKKTPTIETAAPASSRSKVLAKYTATQLHDLIGDAPIGVSLKELKLIVLAKGRDAILKEAGL